MREVWSDLAHNNQLVDRAGGTQSIASSPKHTGKINPAINERVAMLAARFPKAGDEVEEYQRLRLLALDLSETMDTEALDAAIAAGRMTWRFFPTLAEIIEAAQPFLAERRARQRYERERREAAERRRLPAPTYVTPTDTAAILRDLYAKIDADARALRGSKTSEPMVPHSERPLPVAAPLVSDASDALKAMVSARLPIFD